MGAPGPATPLHRGSPHLVARNCRRTRSRDTEPDEDIEVVLVPLGELRRFLREDQLSVVDGAYLALDALGLL